MMMMTTVSTIVRRLSSIPVKKRKAAKSWMDRKSSKSINYFVDWKRVRTVGGKGGDGRIANTPVYLIEFAGPDGGDGGHGGHVIFRAKRHISSLNHVASVVRGYDGVVGNFKNCDGKSAKHRFVDVPIGTIFRNLERDILAELDTEDAMFIAAKGGEGGKGNAYFKSPTRQMPFIAECGGFGEDFTFEVELRTMAHFGLIGFPNAGKSTLLRAVSRARPKVAAYPFTTLNPHVGMVQYDDYVDISVADIPGLIKDAHLNKGLGISFLRHVQRCIGLLYVIDVSQPDPWLQLEILRHELEHFQKGLSQRPHAIIANKIDLEDGIWNVKEWEKRLSPTDLLLLPVSAKTGINVKKLMDEIRRIYDEQK